MDDLGEEFTANAVRTSLKNKSDAKCEARLTNRLTKKCNPESAQEFYQYVPIKQIRHRVSVTKLLKKFRTQIQAIEEVNEFNESSKESEVLRIKLDMWVLIGSCRYGKCWQKLDQVAKNCARAGKAPHGYQYPELFKLNEMPKELSEAL